MRFRTLLVALGGGLLSLAACSDDPALVAPEAPSALLEAQNARARVSNDLKVSSGPGSVKLADVLTGEEARSAASAIRGDEGSTSVESVPFREGGRLHGTAPSDGGGAGTMDEPVCDGPNPPPDCDGTPGSYVRLYFGSSASAISSNQALLQSFSGTNRTIFEISVTGHPAVGGVNYGSYTSTRSLSDFAGVGFSFTKSQFEGPYLLEETGGHFFRDGRLPNGSQSRSSYDDRIWY